MTHAVLYVISLDVLHVFYARLLSGHSCVHVGDSSRRSEEMIKNLELHLSMKSLSSLCASTGGVTPVHSHFPDRLVGLVVRCPPRERKIPGSNPACDGIFSGSSHTSDFKIGTPVATLPGAWRYRVSTGTGRPGVSIL